MKSEFQEVMPQRVRRALAKFGGDLAIARRKRRLTVAMVAQRVGISPRSYVKVEKGDPSVKVGIYAMALFVLGFPDIFSNLADVSRDDTGLLLDIERLPKRVRVKKEPVAL